MNHLSGLAFNLGETIDMLRDTVQSDQVTEGVDLVDFEAAA